MASALVLAACVAPFVIRVEPPAPPGGWHVNVRWAPSVGDAERADLEAKYGLLLLQPHAERTWVYRLRDSSRPAVQALVSDPRVEDTYGIDRNDFRVSAPRLTLARQLADRYPGVAERLTPRAILRVLLLASLVLLLFVLSQRADVRAMASTGVPQLSSGALGLYRAALALALVTVVLKYADLPDAPFPRELHRAYDWFADWPWVHVLASTPTLEQWSTPACVALLVFFGTGLLSRPAYLAFLAVLTVHVLVVLQHKSAHDWGLPLVTLWGLALVPWSEGAGIDTWRRGAAAPRRNYGFAVWFPGLMVGLAFAAAAWAKLDSSGIEWVTGGAVKYHFIEDARQAPNDWGLRIASREGFAVALSAGAILVEALFIVHVFFRNAWARAAAGVAGLTLLAGFRVLQGVMWMQWWVLFLCFVPWQPIARVVFGDRRESQIDGAAPALRRGAAAVVAVVVSVQLVASAYRIEMEPFVSDYGMYSWTWPSRAAFDRYIAGKYRRYGYQVVEGNGARDVTPRLARLPKAADLLGQTVTELQAGQALGEDRRKALAALAREYRETYHERLSPMVVVVDELGFDWSRGRFYVISDDRPIGTLDVERATLAEVPDRAAAQSPSR